MRKVKLLVVGQVPPPYGGQAIMIQKLLEASYPDIEIFHVPMHFSQKMGEMGNFNIRKSIEVLVSVVRIFRARFLKSCTILYYVPAGLSVSRSFSLLPILRDMVILLLTRWLFSKTIFHIHAGGIGQLYNKFPIWLKPLFRQVYWNPDAVIQLSTMSPNDGELIHARKTYYVPNGIEDVYFQYAKDELRSTKRISPTVLYVGGLFECKGILDLLLACKILENDGISFSVILMGQGPNEFEKRIVEFIKTNHMSEIVDLIGEKIDSDKWHIFSTADIFCFPTFCPSETFGLVLIEAMMFALPIVSTRWSGIPTIVSDGVHGFLVPPQQPELLAEKLRELTQNSNLRYEMGQKGRERFLQEFTIEKYYERLRRIFLDVANEQQGVVV
jgi:glycosyltransferase involved in cell wall biosynthesis